MKKKITCCIVVILAIVFSFNISPTSNQTVSSLTLECIEALAQGEGYGTNCLYTGSLDCPSNSIKVRYLW